VNGRVGEHGRQPAFESLSDPLGPSAARTNANGAPPQPDERETGEFRAPDLRDSASVCFEPEPSEAEPEPVPDLGSNHRRAGRLRICSVSATPGKSAMGSGGLEFPRRSPEFSDIRRQSQRLYNRTGGPGGGRQNRVAVATWWVSRGRNVGGDPPDASDPVAARHLWITKKLNDIAASAVGMALAPMPGGWRECA
jgi:hypothetical protein